MGYTYAAGKGKDVMLGDLYVRLMSRNFGGDIFADKQWLEARVEELSRHHNGAAYTLKGWNRINKESVAKLIDQMMEKVDQTIHQHTMPTYAIEDVKNVLSRQDVSEQAVKECEEKLKEALAFISAEEAPDIFYTRPQFNPRTYEHTRRVIRKEAVVDMVKDLLGDVREKQAGQASCELGEE